MVKVKIKGTVITAQYGALSSGDILVTSEAFAKHLVDDCGAAEYLTEPAKTEEIVSEKPLKTSKKAK
jgi:hypothetical protein